VYFIINGTGMIYVDEEHADVGPGRAVYVPPNARQFIRNVSDAPLEFLCIVDPAWRQEDETYD
jgi:mannose-6-phosphate isomerase-like protein (cupin superfamily)